MRSLRQVSVLCALLLPGSVNKQQTEEPRALCQIETHDCLKDFNSLPAELRQGGPAEAERVIVVYKRQKKTALYEHGQLTLCASSDFGDWPYEPKVRSDGESTPEGWYTVSVKRTSDPTDEFPRSFFTEALHVSYPNKGDVDRAVALSVVTPAVAGELYEQINRGELPSQETGMGGAILIHNWQADLTTAGCVGLSEENMHSLFSQVKNGDPVLILPWQTIMFEDGTTAQDVTPARPEPEPFPVGMIDQTKSRPGFTVMLPIEITAD